MVPDSLYPLFLKSRAITIDSRKVKKGDIFFALKGEKTDGNRYATQALEQGAAAAIVDDHQLKEVPGCIWVPNVLTALQNLAKHHRSQLSIPVIGLTGSNGKTTTKKLIFQLLASKFRAFCTPGNYNNHIGVPLTILQITENTEIAVIEMGANHQKEIAFLSSIAQPTHGLITNIGKAHLEGFAGIEGVKKGKGELYDFLANNNGVVFYNKEERFLPEMAKRVNRRVGYQTEGRFLQEYKNIELAVNQLEPNISFDIIQADPSMKWSCQVALFGPYNYSNVVAAMVIAKYFEVSWTEIQSSLGLFEPESFRSEQIEWKSNTVLMDAYNANPNSMKVAIASFIKLKQHQSQIMVLGEMYELGPYAEEEHQRIVEICNQLKGVEVIFVGLGFKDQALQHQKLWYANTEELMKMWELNPPVDCHILLKGSRGVALERLLN